MSEKEKNDATGESEAASEQKAAPSGSEGDAVGAEASADEAGNDNQPGKTEWTDEQVAELKDQALRLMADMENLRKRHIRELDEARKYAMTGFARDLLDVVDNLGRALSAVPAAERGQNSFLETLVTGVEMTERMLLSAFEKSQISRVHPERGERFDHNRHQAMFEVPTNDVAPGSVADVVQSGYVLADRLLRPAMVGVAKAAPKPAEASGPAGQASKGNKVDTSA